MTNELSFVEVRRWTGKRKVAVVLDLIAGKTTAADGSPQPNTSTRSYAHKPPN